MSDNGVVRCPLCHEAVDVSALGDHLHGHSTWTVISHSFKRWPAWTAAVVIGALVLGIILYLAISELAR